MAMNGIDEMLDFFARDSAGSSGVIAGYVQYALNQLHRIIVIESIQLTSIPLVAKWLRQRLTRGEDDACFAGFQQPLAYSEDRVQLFTCFRCHFRDKRWQENA